MWQASTLLTKIQPPKGHFILFNERNWNNEACVDTEVMELADALYKKTREGAYCDGSCLHLVKVLNDHEWS